jgi:hypothetical protein
MTMKMEKVEKTLREEILEQATAAVVVDRSNDYGRPEANFGRIAEFWSTYLGIKIHEHDVAAMMVLLKVSRITTSPGLFDHWVDIAGYAACGGEVRFGERQSS